MCEFINLLKVDYKNQENLVKGFKKLRILSKMSNFTKKTTTPKSKVNYN